MPGSGPTFFLKSILVLLIFLEFHLAISPYVLCIDCIDVWGCLDPKIHWFIIIFSIHLASIMYGIPTNHYRMIAERQPQAIFCDTQRVMF